MPWTEVPSGNLACSILNYLGKGHSGSKTVETGEILNFGFLSTHTLSLDTLGSLFKFHNSRILFKLKAQENVSSNDSVLLQVEKRRSSDLTNHDRVRSLEAQVSSNWFLEVSRDL